MTKRRHTAIRYLFFITFIGLVAATLIVFFTTGVNTANAVGHNCQEFDSTGDGNYDAEVCIENLSASPSSISVGENTAIDWDIVWSAAADGNTEVECNVLGNPSLADRSTLNPPYFDGPVTLEYSDFSSFPTDVEVRCEAADDADGPEDDPDNYDDMYSRVEVTKDNSDPNASNDGNNEAKICSDDAEPVDIDVLSNDTDPDNDPLSIDSVGNPSSGSTVIVTKNGKEYVRYTPGTKTGTITFDYTVSDGQGGTDTATVTVNVTESCGGITVRVEDQDGNLVEDAEFAPEYGGDRLPVRGQETGKFTYNVVVSDSPELSKMSEDLIESYPEGYASSVDQMEKDVEKVNISGQTHDEPDDFWYPIEDRDDTQSKLATNITSGGGGGTNTCTKTIKPQDWSGETESTSVESDGDDDYYEDYQKSDGEVTATLDVTDHVDSDETIQSVEVPYKGRADCDYGAEDCYAEASTEISADTGESVSDNIEINSPGESDSYSGILTINDSSVSSLSATNDSYASVERASDGPDVLATAYAAIGETALTVETSDSCDGGGNDGDTDGTDDTNVSPTAFSIFPSYSGPNNKEITLNALADDPDDTSLTYEWYRGGTTSGSPDGSGKTYSLGAKSCSYSQDWTLLVSDGQASDTITQTIEASSSCTDGGGGGGDGGADPIIQ